MGIIFSIRNMVLGLCVRLGEWSSNGKHVIEDTTDPDYKHARRFLKDFGTKNFGECHNLNLQSTALCLADIFRSFRNKHIDVYDLILLIFFQQN